MRNVSFASRVVAFVAVFSVSAIGQQSSSISLPVEPASAPSVITLADAAAHNDFPLFDAMYNNALRSEATPFAELHSFWKWSLTDPIGGFYGDDIHARFAAEYPGYAEYIAAYGIIDSHGRAFYPSSETRTFLLRQAILGRSPLVAREEWTPRVPVSAVPPATHVARVTHNVQTAARSAQSRPAPVRARESKPVVEAKPVVVAPVAVAPVVAVPALAAPAIAAPAVIATPVVKPQVASPLAAAVMTPKVTTKKVVVAAASAKPALKSDARLGRGLLLILAGLIGLGMLSVMLHAPGEEPVAESMDQAHPLEPTHMLNLDQKPKKTA